MAVKDVFSAHLIIGYEPAFPSDLPIYEDITSGILNVDIQFGTDVYEGPQQQIDTGLFTIVSRGSILDPNINSNVIEGAEIEFRDSRDIEEGKTNVFFSGFITDIDVQYQREDDPIITITGTDNFGLLQRTVVSEDIKNFALSWSAGLEPTDPDINGPSLTTLVEHTSWQDYVPVEVNVIDPIINPIVPGQIDNAIPYNVYLGYNPARYLPELGETLLEVLNKYTQTNLNYCSINYRETPKVIDVYPYAKYNAFFWPPMSDPALEFTTYNFSSDPADDKPYESILINNRYNRKSKSLAISNETRLWDEISYDNPVLSTTTSYPPFKVDEFDTSVATNLDTIFASAYVDNDALDLYATDIFQVVNFGSDEIQQITFDNARKEDIDNDRTYSFSQLNQFIRIKHEVNENYTIDRFYDIAGVTHNITPDKWEMGFTFKPAQNEIAFSYQGQIPTIEMNALTGDSNFNFTATITDYPIEDIQEVIWCLNGTNSNVNEQWTYSATGERYKDLLQRNGLTQTWNFDDDGILEGNIPTGGYGTGEWYVIPYIFLKNGWVIAPHVMLTVGTPEVEARFLWSQNLTNNFGQVTFTDDSRNNEIGEPDSYAWDFGDGNTSALQNPVHQYDPDPDETEYEVSLTVFAYGEDEEKIYNTHTETVTLVQPEMTANFTFSVFGNEVTFTNTSTNVGFEEPDAYLWNFGDGETSTEKNPFHVFPAPEDETLTFSVTLTTRNIWEQTSTITKTVTIIAENATGSLPVRYIQLRQGTMYGLLPADNGPNMVNVTSHNSTLKARTSKTKANLLYLKPIINTTKTNVSLTYWEGNPLAEPALSTSLTSGLGMSIKRNILNAATDFKITIDLQEPTNYINDMTMLALSPYQSTPGAFAEVDVFTTTETGTLANPDTATWFKIGSFETALFTVGGQSRTETMFPIRPMPLNVPYFYYTITNHTASFTSVETADSYLWTFGDGTTSTLKNPVKIFPRRGTYNVTLAVTTGGIVTRTTTEPVIIKSLVPFNVRHIKFVQNEHTGTYAFDTPTLVNFKATKGPYELPVAYSKKSLTDFQYEDYPMDICNAGTSSQSAIPITSSSGSTPYNMWFSYGGSWNATGYNNIFGIRAKSLDASFRTSWSLVVDLNSINEGIEDMQVDLRRDQISVGAPYPAAAGISYSVYVTNVTTATINPLTVPWTKIGDFVPTDIPTGTLGGTQTWIIEAPETYHIIPS